MRFYRKEARDRNPPPSADYPCVVLSFDRWNDYGARTQFDMHFWAVQGSYMPCGSVKILQLGSSETQLPETFTQLDNSYCSLGQSIDYYRRLDSLGEVARVSIVDAVNDIVYYRERGEQFKEMDEFKSSLLRFSEAEKLYEEGLSAFDFGPVHSPLGNFSFACRLEGATADHMVAFNFRDKDPLPGRIIAMIGMNGTGKTRYMRRLAEAVVKGPLDDQERFTPERPRFSRVIAISYSAFDEFRKPPSDSATSFYHCGIYDEKGILKDLSALASEVKRNLELSHHQARMGQLTKALREILSPLIVEHLTVPVQRLGGYYFPDVAGLRLSSGQLVLVSILSHLATLIEPDSLVVFDEPELHLHPNAIGGLMRAINTALGSVEQWCLSVK